MFRCLIVGGLGLCLAGSMAADVVLLKDGRRYTGEVTKTADGYIVKTKLGTIVVAEADFSQLILDSSGGASTPTPSPMRTTTVTAPVAPVAPAAAVPNKNGIKSLQPLLDQGKSALAAGDYKAARDAFSDAASIDPKNVLALHGAGVAYMYLNDFKHAGVPMEKALTAAAAAPDRALVLNMAVLQIGLQNPMRATKIIRDYLTAHPKELDEPMLNAMGTAMSLASDSARKQTLFQETIKFYLMYNLRLEADRSGYKRWGVEWLPASEVDRRMASNAAAQKKIHSIGTELDELEVKINAAERDLIKKRDLHARGFVTDFELEQAESNQQRQKDEYARKSPEWDAAVASIQNQPFPLTMSLVALDELTPPPVGGKIAVAVVTPTEAIPKPSIPRPRKVKTDTNASATGASGKSGGMTPVEISSAPVITVVQAPIERKPSRVIAYAAAFPISSDLVVTSAAVVKDANRIDLQGVDGDPFKADVVRVDEGSGLALLRVSGKRLTGMTLASTFTGGVVQCAGFPTVNLFNPASEAISGMAKAPSAEWKVNLSKHPRLPGAPLLAGNKVVGVTLATRDVDAGQAPAVTLEDLKKFLGTDAPVGGGNGPEPTAVMIQVMATRETAG